jgi:hypothetical protein
MASIEQGYDDVTGNNFYLDCLHSAKEQAQSSAGQNYNLPWLSWPAAVKHWTNVLGFKSSLNWHPVILSKRRKNKLYIHFHLKSLKSLSCLTNELYRTSQTRTVNLIKLFWHKFTHTFMVS